MKLFKKLACTLFVFLPILLFSQHGGIQWTNGLTWEQVKQKAKVENKLIFVDAYATWCVPCKKMDKEVYPSKEVGESVNPKFISVKIQMDQTENDDPVVKSWYSVAKEMNEDYNIEGYPSFLFFNSDGKLVHKALGFRDVLGFIEVTKDALTDPEKKYKNSIEKFNNGQLDFLSMPELARSARDKKNKQIALEIANRFKQGYLDKLNDEDAFRKENLSFMVDFAWDLMKSTDRYFKLLYAQPTLADSILNSKISNRVTIAIIGKEEIFDRVYKSGNPVTASKVKWSKYKKNIKQKYGKRYLDYYFPDEQIGFYQVSKDWNNYIKYVNLKIKKCPPTVGGNKFNLYGDAWGLNHYAWTLFKYCGDPRLLQKALPWVDCAIKLDSTSYNFNYYDTKANLLYRTNKIKEALQFEQIAVDRSTERERKEVNETLEKMKAGKPTWPADGERN